MTETERDDCEVCRGSRGGVKGNENIIDGLIMCDYCHIDRPKAKFRVGERVLVHQSPGISVDKNGAWQEVPHDCSNPEHHWKSRIVTAGHVGYPYPRIAMGVREENGNVCNGSWPYPDDSLTPLDDGTADWTLWSGYLIGQKVDLVLPRDTPQYKAGVHLTATLLSPHIEPKDWYLRFLTPEDRYGAWWFTMVVNETEFKALGVDEPCGH